MTFTPRFEQRIANNIRYWQHQTGQPNEKKFSFLEAERQNVWLAVQCGLKAKATQTATATLVAQIFSFIEQQSYWIEWIPVVNAAANVCDATHSQLKSQLLNQLGFLYRLQRNWKAAAHCHEQVIALEQSSGGTATEAAEATFHLANLYYDRRQYQLAQDQAVQALSLFDTLQLNWDAKKMAAVFNLLGLLYQARGKHQEAVEQFMLSLGHWEKIAEPTYQARTHYNLGLSLSALGAHHDALAQFAAAMHKLAPTRNLWDQIKVEINRGVVYYRMTQWDEAENAFQRADIPFLQQIGDSYHQALIANNLGHVALEKKEVEKAGRFFKKAIVLWQATGDNLMLANSLGTLGELAAATGEIAEALNYYDQSIALLTQFPEDAWGQERLRELVAQKEQLGK